MDIDYMRNHAQDFYDAENTFSIPQFRKRTHKYALRLYNSNVIHKNKSKILKKLNVSEKILCQIIQIVKDH